VSCTEHGTAIQHIACEWIDAFVCKGGILIDTLTAAVQGVPVLLDFIMTLLHWISDLNGASGRT
jgi:hypothetical protein